MGLLVGTNCTTHIDFNYIPLRNKQILIGYNIFNKFILLKCDYQFPKRLVLSRRNCLPSAGLWYEIHIIYSQFSYYSRAFLFTYYVFTKWYLFFRWTFIIFESINYVRNLFFFPFRNKPLKCYTTVFFLTLIFEGETTTYDWFSNSNLY